MKKEEIEKISKAGEKLKEEIINCHNCSHKPVCITYRNSKMLYRDDIVTWDELGEIGKKSNCKHFHYKDFETYSLDQFKDLLKRKIDNSSAYPLITLYEILKLLEVINEK